MGNPLQIGREAMTTFTDPPTYDPVLTGDEPFTSDWTLGNSGDLPGQVTLKVIMNRLDTQIFFEFTRLISVNAGGGIFDFDILWEDLMNEGIGRGRYSLRFLVLDQNENPIGQTFSGEVLIN